MSTDLVGRLTVLYRRMVSPNPGDDDVVNYEQSNAVILSRNLIKKEAISAEDISLVARNLSTDTSSSKMKKLDDMMAFMTNGKTDGVLQEKYERLEEAHIRLQSDYAALQANTRPILPRMPAPGNPAVALIVAYLVEHEVLSNNLKSRSKPVKALCLNWWKHRKTNTIDASSPASKLKEFEDQYSTAIMRQALNHWWRSHYINGTVCFQADNICWKSGNRPMARERTPKQ